MRVIRNRPEWTDEAYVSGRSVVAIGNFDGVHRGHLALIERCHAVAGTGDTVAVVTFEPLPLAYFRPDNPPARISTVYQKLKILASLGVELTWQMRFGRRFSALSARDFVITVLVERLNVRTVVVGEDFRFGRAKEGDVAMLRLLGAEFGFDVETVPAVCVDGQRVSSSGIRQWLAAGDFERTEKSLGRPFRMEGHVVQGAALGRKLGYPTANLKVRAQPCPLGGVLAVFSRIDGGPWLPGVSNLGRRPAVGGKEPLLEVHFFDFDADIYGKRLDVQFVAKLRDEANFSSMDDLIVQMKRDEQEARMCLAQASVPEDRQ